MKRPARIQERTNHGKNQSRQVRQGNRQGHQRGHVRKVPSTSESDRRKIRSGRIGRIDIAGSHYRRSQSHTDPPAPPTPDHGLWFAPTMGILAGFTTLIANAAGPVMTLYLLFEHQRTPDAWMPWRSVVYEVAAVEANETLLRISKIGPSPLPGDRRRCAFTQLA